METLEFSLFGVVVSCAEGVILLISDVRGLIEE